MASSTEVIATVHPRAHFRAAAVLLVLALASTTVLLPEADFLGVVLPLPVRIGIALMVVLAAGIGAVRLRQRIRSSDGAVALSGARLQVHVLPFGQRTVERSRVRHVSEVRRARGPSERVWGGTHVFVVEADGSGQELVIGSSTVAEPLEEVRERVSRWASDA